VWAGGPGPAGRWGQRQSGAAGGQSTVGSRLSLPCVSVASGHKWGTQLLQSGFGMDREPGDAAGEVSPCDSSHGRGPASSHACQHGAASSRHTGPEPPHRVRTEPRGTREPPCAPSRSHYLLPPSAPHWEPGQPLHKATTLAPAQGGGSGLSPLAGCPHCTVPVGVSQWGREPALSSTRSAPARFTATTGEAHILRGVPAVPAAILMAVSPVPCRVSWDTSTTRTPGCSGWAQPIASSLSGSARYGPHREGSSGPTGMSQPRSLQRLCQGPGCFFGWCIPHGSRRPPHWVAGPLLGTEGGWLARAVVPHQRRVCALQMREREVKLWDTRQFSKAMLTVALDTSPG